MNELYTDVEILELLGQRIKQLRTGRKQSQQELADFCGVSRRTILLFEQGKGISLLSFIRILRNFDLQQEVLSLIPSQPNIDPFDM
jgi:transcriptional regulator with XRE-family HTH domain